MVFLVKFYIFFLFFASRSLKLFTPKFSIVILLTVCHTIFMKLVQRIWYWSTNNPLIDIFLYFHHLSAWYNVDIIWKSYVLVTHGTVRVYIFFLQFNEINLQFNSNRISKQKVENTFLRSLNTVHLQFAQSFLHSFILPININLSQKMKFEIITFFQFVFGSSLIDRNLPPEIRNEECYSSKAQRFPY